jgi:hypothetical protein
MGGLAIARVPYGTFLRFVWPLLLALEVVSVDDLETAGQRWFLICALGGIRTPGRLIRRRLLLAGIERIWAN